jgi:hypothetical protein
VDPETLTAEAEALTVEPETVEREALPVKSKEGLFRRLFRKKPT